MIINSKLPSSSDYEFIRRLVYEHSRINLGGDKIHLVGQRIQKRLRITGMESYKDYCNYLKSPEGEDELTNLLDVISTNVTSFFREAKHFDFLRLKVLPEWVQRHANQTGSTFRAWSAACSSGEEPYTMALVLVDFFRQHPSFNWEVIGSDISTRMLDRAARGIYRKEQLNLPHREWLRRYFLKGTKEHEGFCRVKKEIQEHISFYHLNLFQPALPFSDMMDVIFCRNVMIYFDHPTQEQLIRRLAAQLLPNGYLIVGHSESLIGVNHSLKSLQPSIYSHGAGAGAPIVRRRT